MSCPCNYEFNLQTTDADSSHTRDTEDVDLKYLKNSLPSVFNELDSVGKDDILTKFMVLVCEKYILRIILHFAFL